MKNMGEPLEVKKCIFFALDSLERKVETKKWMIYYLRVNNSSKFKMIFDYDWHNKFHHFKPVALYLVTMEEVDITLVIGRFRNRKAINFKCM